METMDYMDIAMAVLLALTILWIYKTKNKPNKKK